MASIATRYKKIYDSVDADKLRSVNPALYQEWQGIFDDTESFTDDDLVEINEDVFNLLYEGIKGKYPQLIAGLLPPKKPITEAQRKRASTVKKNVSKVEKAKSTRTAETKTFAERMKAARDAKRKEPEDNPGYGRDVEELAAALKGYVEQNDIGSFTKVISSQISQGFGHTVSRAFEKMKVPSILVKYDPKDPDSWSKSIRVSFLFLTNKGRQPHEEPSDSSSKKSTSSKTKAPKTASTAKGKTVKPQPEPKAKAAPKPKPEPKAKAAPKPKPDAKPRAAKKPTKTEQANAAYKNADKVAHPRVEIGHIKRFLALLNDSNKQKITTAFQSVKRDVKSQRIRKSSKLVNEIMLIQRAYRDVLVGSAPYKPDVPETKKAELVAIVAGEKVYKSVELLGRYIGWMGSDRNEKQVKELLNLIENADKAGKIGKSDPYAAELMAVKNDLKKAVRASDYEPLNLSGLSGLAGIGGLSGLGDLGCDCDTGSVGYVATGPNQTHSGRNGGFAPVMSSHDLMKTHYPTYNLTGDWQALIGNPQTNFKLMIWGAPGAGKSTLAISLARYLASEFGPALYVSSEEYVSHTLKDKLSRVGGDVPGLDFTKDPNRLTARHKFLVIDSVNHYGWTQDDLIALCKRRPDLSVILVFQATKDGKFKGPREWEHDVDTVISVYETGKARTTKNRFAPLSDIEIF